jgi:hypothetical protein
MAGRGSTTHLKRQKELQRKERRQEKLAKRLQRKNEPRSSSDSETGLTPEAEVEPQHES